MRLAVVGSRGFTNKKLLYSILDQYLEDNPDLVIVSGGAKGADSLAQDWAFNNKVECKIYPADWTTHGKAAGFIRNKLIWDDSDEGIAFWDGQSNGTKHSFELSRKQKKQLVVIMYKGNDFELLDTLEDVI